MKKVTVLPADTNKRAKKIVDALTGSEDKPVPQKLKSAAAILGRMGGLKGGKARAASLTPKERSEIAKKAAAARWGKRN